MAMHRTSTLGLCLISLAPPVHASHPRPVPGIDISRVGGGSRKAQGHRAHTHADDSRQGGITANSQGGFGCTNCKTDRVDQNMLESRSMEISPWGLVVFSCLDCDVREVS